MATPVDLAALVAMAESSTNAAAIRFEPTHKVSAADALMIQHFNHCTIQTAINLGATSIGQYQMMIDTLYELGYERTVQEFWGSIALQTQYFYKLCSSRGINYSLDDILNSPQDLHNFAHHYNGDANTYSTHLLAVYQEMKNT